MAAKGLQNGWGSNSKSKVPQQRHSSSCLSEAEVLLCCALVVQSMNPVFDHWTASVPGLINGMANVYSTVRNKLRSLTANKPAGSAMRQPVNSDLSAAVVQYTTSRLRSDITSSPIAVNCCLDMLVLVAALDPSPRRSSASLSSKVSKSLIFVFSSCKGVQSSYVSSFLA